MYQESALEIINDLKGQGYTIISIEQVEPNILLQDYKTEPDHKYCLVFGNEVNGVDNEVVQASDLCIEIPQSGTKHSLNISVSIGVVLWKFYSDFMF